MYQEIHPCTALSIGSVKLNTSLQMISEWLISAMDLLQPIETSKRIIWEENGRHLILKLPVVDFNMRELFFPTNFLWAKLHELFSEMQTIMLDDDDHGFDVVGDFKIIPKSM